MTKKRSQRSLQAAARREWRKYMRPLVSARKRLSDEEIWERLREEDEASPR